MPLVQALRRDSSIHVSALADPRQQWRVVYPLPEILLVVLCATLSGIEDFVKIKLWGEQRLDFLRRFLPYEGGLAAHDTLNDVVNALDADLFTACFTSWVESLRDGAPTSSPPRVKPGDWGKHRAARRAPARGIGELGAATRPMPALMTSRSRAMGSPNASSAIPFSPLPRGKENVRS